MSLDPRAFYGKLLAGRYRVLRKLGAGGMGTVWLVEHAESLQHYALKTLHPRAAIDRMHLERFLREARAAAALRSKHVVKVIDAQMNHLDPESGDPMPFIVMELLEGENLEEMVRRRGKLPKEEVVWILRQVGRALDLAHQKGIVHRDLKPENLFLAMDEDGDPCTKICDFGIAKLGGDIAKGMLSTGAAGTDGGVMLGTPLYMSPEQARSSSDVVPQSDQWALGLIAFRALTGKEYFGGAIGTAELFVRIFVDPLKLPSELDPTLPEAFDAWMMRSLSRAYAERWPSAGEQTRVLGEALSVTEPIAPHLEVTVGKLAADATKALEGAKVPTSTLGPSPSSSSPHSSQPQAAVTPGGSPATITRSPASTTNHGSTPPPGKSGSIGDLVQRRRPPFMALGVVAVLIAVVALVTWQMQRGRRDDGSAATHDGSAQLTQTTQSASSRAATSDDVLDAAVPPTASAPASIASLPVASTTTAPTAKPAWTSKPPAVTATVTAPKASSAPPPPSKAPKGAPCARSSECMSGFCVAEECQ